MSVDDGDRYASVPERITWSTGFELPIDQMVLAKLATFASFKTGTGARMRIDALVARCGLKRRTVQRALQRLEAGRWIIARRRQSRHATVWDINLDRLATNWIAAKVVPRVGKEYGVLTKTSVTDDAHFCDRGMGVTDDAHSGRITKMSVTGDAQIPCTYVPDPQDLGTSAVQLTLGPADVKPDASRGVYDATRELEIIRAQLATPLPPAAVTRRRHG